MKNLLILAMLAALAWYGHGKYKSLYAGETRAEPSSAVAASGTANAAAATTADPAFACDGRTHCAQMTSCAEATYFLRHCPNTQMDGNNDGQPCEKQWCH